MVYQYIQNEVLIHLVTKVLEPNNAQLFFHVNDEYNLK